MKKNGFTLVELLATIIILSIIGLIAIPAVNKTTKKAKDQLYQVQIDNIEDAAASWAADHPADLPSENGEILQLTIGQLKYAGDLEFDLKNPKTGILFPNDMIVKIERVQNSYTYEVDETSGTAITDDSLLDENFPTITLTGDTNHKVEINKDAGSAYDTTTLASMYEAFNANNTANSSASVTVTDILGNVATVNYTTFGQYKMTYIVTDSVDPSKTATAIRTITIDDTTAPVINGATTLSIASGNVASFNADKWNYSSPVTVTDNGPDAPVTSTIGTVGTTPGVYTITYKAVDTKGNEAIVLRKIHVN